MNELKLANVKSVKLNPGLLEHMQQLICAQVIPYQWEILNDRVAGAEPSHCVENFQLAAGEKRGEYYGMVFQDSDLAKWIEAAAYSLMLHPDAELERHCDGIIATIGRAQQPDGYLNTYFTVKAPGQRWTNLRDCHELYCAGHMMEAACAYFEATGKRALLDTMRRMAYHIDSVLGPEPDKLHGYPGHEEIELALIRMYACTGETLMLKLASYFIDERGKAPKFFHIEQEKRGEGAYRPNPRWPGDEYAQYQLPVREQSALAGHSVRALYLATGMADVARTTGDASLVAACERMFDNLVRRRLYITGGVGSSEVGEAFTFDYDLPNDTVYAETCASIALCFFARAMLQIRPDSRYADVLERALYNTCLAGMSLDGQTFYYVNPLEVDPEASARDIRKRHVLPVRPKWFSCACCPPNLARLLTSIAKYMFTLSDDTIYVNLYSACDADLPLVSAASAGLSIDTEYPLDGNIRISPKPGMYAVAVRIPEFSRAHYSVEVNGAAAELEIAAGYAVVRREWKAGDSMVVKLDMAVRRVYANPAVRADIGRVALMRGPIVYCAEAVDNAGLMASFVLPRGAQISERFRADKLGGIWELSAHGLRLAAREPDVLYSSEPDEVIPSVITFIPYYAWANRGANEMNVWVRE